MRSLHEIVYAHTALAYLCLLRKPFILLFFQVSILDAQTNKEARTSEQINSGRCDLINVRLHSSPFAVLNILLNLSLIKTTRNHLNS